MKPDTFSITHYAALMECAGVLLIRLDRQSQ